MKRTIGTVLALAFIVLATGFWLAPGWMDGVISHGLGLPSAQDRNDYSRLKTMVMSDLKQHGANCTSIKDFEPKGQEGTDTAIGVVICASGEKYELRMHKHSPWEYRLLR